jgi:hypothetical protein
MMDIVNFVENLYIDGTVNSLKLPLLMGDGF